MGETTAIAWTDHTFNPWIGCTKVAPGCAHCYAEADMDRRRGRARWGPNGTRSRTSDGNWRLPYKWDRDAKAAGVRRRVFCSSLADVFEDWPGPIVSATGTVLSRCQNCRQIGDFEDDDCEKCHSDDVPGLTMDDVRADLFEMIDATPNLDWLLLTKRPENIPAMWPRVAGVEYVPEAGAMNDYQLHRRENVWLGTSISDQATADAAIPHLLKCRELCPVRFLSIEPLLDQLEIGLMGTVPKDVAPRYTLVGEIINWVIVGGESGPHARACDVGWIAKILRECQHAGVPCFVKQIGAQPCWNAVRAEKEGYAELLGEYFEHSQILPISEKKGGDMDDWPDSLRVREFPDV